VADSTRIEELRRRVQKDPVSIAFAQLAEELRRAGRFEESIETCEAGLAHHPGYLSAHVTLGRALIEVGALDRAHGELSGVLRAAPENLAALRGLAEIHHRQGDLAKALEHYRAALELARHDPDLEQIVAELSRDLEPRQAPAGDAGGLTFAEMRDEFLAAASAGEAPPAPPPDAAAGALPAPAASPSPWADTATAAVEAGEAIARAQSEELQRWLDVLTTESPSVTRPE